MKTAILALALSLLPAAVHAEFWGSSKSGTYHIASCRYAKKIAKENRIKFVSAADARDAGYKPCEVCEPTKAAPIKQAPDKAKAEKKSGTAGQSER